MNNIKKRSFLSNVYLVILLLIIILLSITIGYKYGTYKMFTSSSSAFDVDRIKAIKSILEEEYLFSERISNNRLTDGAIEGLVGSVGDIYTRYISEEVYEDFRTQTTGKYTGIGVQVTKTENGTINIEEVFKEQSASKAGILPGDKIIKIDGQKIKELNIQDAVGLIKGEIGTDVILTVLRDGIEMDIVIRRNRVVLPMINHKMLGEDIGYIYIGSFNEQTIREFDKAYSDLKKQNIKKLIIDLRDNNGGLLDIGVQLSDKFLNRSDKIVSVKRKKASEIVKAKTGKEINLPLVVLVNENSASTSEIFSASIKENGVGQLVGTKTFGKGLVQNTYRAGEKSMLIVTTAKYLTPDGNDIHGVGITPNIFIGYTKEDMLKGIDPQLNKAIEVLDN